MDEDSMRFLLRALFLGGVIAGLVVALIVWGLVAWLT